MNLHKYLHSLVSLSIVFGVALFAAQSVFAQNPTADENNNNTGTTSWQIPSSRAAMGREIEGYASATSVNKGSPITFYVNATEETSVKIDIYRMGYYPNGAGGGYGGRLIANLTGLQVQPQPLPEADHETGLIECNWAATTQWTPSTSLVSGFYLAKLRGRNKDSYIIFVVRDDDRTSDFVFQSAVTTYQAYNYFPGDRGSSDWTSGKSLYGGIGFGPVVPDGAPSQYQDKQARMVSFNRPYLPDNNTIYKSAGQFFQWEYNMVRWMESEGVDVTYITNIDTHADSGNFTAGKHKAFLTAGHDEYYSWEMRDNLEQARNRSSQPQHIGFFSSNDVYWQIRFANSSSSGTAPANAANRTIICYKLHVADGDYGDPNWVNDGYLVPILTDNHLITQQWRDNKTYIATCPGGGTSCYKEPEDELVGAMTHLSLIEGFGNYTFAAACPAWIRAGFTQSSFTALVGYEPVRVVNSYSGRTLSMVGDSTATNSSTSGPAHSVYYKMSTGGRVFSAGSNYWSWGVDPFPVGQTNVPAPGGWSSTMYNSNVELMTMNILNCFKNGGSSCGE